uniref:NADH dehydrogenase subunit 2 n=1 Tax=Apystomyia elinguis TaxID=797143 RepID=UPI0026E1671A|nr:NADH dehydrogenase subunit 2 [Apystomyia elinguis]WJW73489.1 NADH dehydrogenase subunit 2 [Apystomyia elinguis]
MFKTSSKLMMLLILMMGTLLTISSSSWLSAWMGLEINLLSFIPLMNDTNNLMSTEASLKYFLTQALASSILLFAIIISLTKTNMMININLPMNAENSIILSSLLLKSGSAPFHFWFPSIMEGLSWINSLILMTWQKLAPLMLISYLMIKPILTTSIILSVIVGAMGGLNQTSLRKLMAFSSIGHLSWMLASMWSNESLWFSYFLFYSFLSITLIYFFNLFNLFHINQLFTTHFNMKSLKFCLFFNLLSLGGLPPFLGFLPKWLVIQCLTTNSQLLIMAVMVMFALVTLFFYLRLCYSAFMLNYTETNWTVNMKFNHINMYSYLIMSFMSITGLFSISLIFML